MDAWKVKLFTEFSIFLGLSGYFDLEKKDRLCFYKECLIMAENLGNISNTAHFNLLLNVGILYKEMNQFPQALKFYKKTIQFAIKMGYKKGEGWVMISAGNVLCSLSKYQEAIEYHEKSLDIALEIGDKSGEVKCYMNFGNVYSVLGKYQKAIKYYFKSLNIAVQIGDKSVEEKCYMNIGILWYLFGKYKKTFECYKKSLSIALEIGDKSGEGDLYVNIGNVYKTLGKLKMAAENYEKSLIIFLEIGEKHKVGMAYTCLGSVNHMLGKTQEAMEYYENGLRITTEIGDKSTEAKINRFLGHFYHDLSIKANSTEYDDESCKNNLELSVHYLKESVRCWDYVFEHSHKQDDSKISIFDTFIHAYKLLTTVLIEKQELEEALLVSDHGRARALEDILVSKYGLNKLQAVSRTPLVFHDVTNLLSNNNFCILFFGIGMKGLCTWVITSQKPLLFLKNKLEEFQLQCGEQDKEDKTEDNTKQEEIKVEDKEEKTEGKEDKMEDRIEDSITQTLLQLINDSFHKMKVMQTLKCEKPSFESLLNADQDDDPDVELHVSPFGRKGIPDEETQNSSQQEIDPLETLFNVLITPVIHELEQEEIVIIPDGPLYMVPFAALRDPKTGLFLSEIKRIRLAPSLRTLKTLQECQLESHCKTGALIVGDPAVGEVIFQGKKKIFDRLSSAEHEAKIIGGILNAKPLIGSQATKQYVKDKLRESVAIIHIAAHGISENGNIVLAPSLQKKGGTPKEEDYMLTMQEVQEIAVKAQLVFLSYCHSGLGEISSEGVIGMSRAFLAAGARAVVASLWDVDDEAARTFMVSFYMYLKQGESASKSLQKAMSEVREEGYVKTRHWAPFYLIGDNVTIEIH